jgi:hypothetical protein
MEAVRSADPKQEALTVVVEQWRTLLGDGRVSVREVIDSATRKRPGLFNYSDEYVNPDFREALLVVAGDRGSVNSYRLGNWLSANENRIVNGARFVAAGITAGIGRWRLEPVKP